MLPDKKRLEVIKSRTALVRHRKAQRAKLALGLASTATFVALVATIASFSQGGFGDVQGLYGSVLRYGDVVSYVLVAICSFVLAAALTIAVHKTRERRLSRYLTGVEKDENHV